MTIGRPGLLISRSGWEWHAYDQHGICTGFGGSLQAALEDWDAEAEEWLVYNTHHEHTEFIRKMLET